MDACKAHEFEPQAKMATVIDYRDHYDRLKDKSAQVWTCEMEMFSRLWYWRRNDKRHDPG